jgi:hypothetical protein
VAISAEATAARAAEAANAAAIASNDTDVTANTSAITAEAATARAAEAANAASIAAEATRASEADIVLQSNIDAVSSDIISLKNQHPNIFVIPKTISIHKTRNFVDETANPMITFTVTTTNLVNESPTSPGDDITYTLSGTGITPDDFETGTEMSGNIGTGSGTFTKTFIINKDETTESGGDEVLIFAVSVPNYPELVTEETLIIRDTSYNSEFTTNNYTVTEEAAGTTFWNWVSEGNLQAVAHMNISEVKITPSEELSIATDLKNHVDFPTAALVSLGMTTSDINDFVNVVVSFVASAANSSLDIVLPEFNNGWCITQGTTNLLPDTVVGDRLTSGSSTYIIDNNSEYTTSLIPPTLSDIDKLSEIQIRDLLAAEIPGWNDIPVDVQNEVVLIITAIQDIIIPLMNLILDAMTTTIKLYSYRKLVETYDA